MRVPRGFVRSVAAMVMPRGGIMRMAPGVLVRWRRTEVVLPEGRADSSRDRRDRLNGDRECQYGGDQDAGDSSKHGRDSISHRKTPVWLAGSPLLPEIPGL
jgi:hypothetical protein